MMGMVRTACSNRIATDVRKLSTATRLPEDTDPASVRTGEMKGPNGHSTLATFPRDLSIICSELYRRCFSGPVIAARKTQKILPFNFMLSFPRTAEAWYRSGSLPGAISWTKSVRDGGAATPSVSTLAKTKSTNVVKDVGLQ